MVYRGGLENRFGLTPDGGSNPSLSASPGLEWRVRADGLGSGEGSESRLGKPERAKFVNWTSIIIWVAVVGIVFGYLWWQGQIRQLAEYVQETREELKKCSWPSWAELKGSTLVIIISIALLAVFTEVVDRVLYFVFFVI